MGEKTGAPGLGVLETVLTVVVGLAIAGVTRPVLTPTPRTVTATTDDTGLALRGGVTPLLRGADLLLLGAHRPRPNGGTQAGVGGLRGSPVAAPHVGHAGAPAHTVAAPGRGLHPPGHVGGVVLGAEIVVAAGPVVPETDTAPVAARLPRPGPRRPPVQVPAAKEGVLGVAPDVATVDTRRVVVPVEVVETRPVPRGHRLVKDAFRDEGLAGSGGVAETVRPPAETGLPDGDVVGGAQGPA